MTLYTVDPTIYHRFDQRQTVFGRRGWDRAAPFYGKGVHDQALALIRDDRDGYSRLEYARLRAAWTVSDRFRGAYAWEPLDGGDPVLAALGPHPADDRAAMSAAVVETARMYGASLVGIAPLDRRWVYSHDMQGRPIEIRDGFHYAVVMAIAMDAGAIATSPAYLAGSATGVGYSRMAYAIACLAAFVRNLGYRAIPMGNDTALSIPLAIDAGLGELGRNGLLVTREYGPCVRLCKVFTDLPLEPDAPSASGIADTCRRCRRCAEACEVGAIQDDPAPSYRTVSPSNNRGIERWAVDHDACYGFWIENGASCSTCIAACPYTRQAGPPV
jgi:epoxyqueuosine reductase